MTTDQTTTNDTTADAVTAGEDTALGAAATDTRADTATTDADTAKADAGSETDQAVAGAPESYDVAAFTMPEGVEFDTEGFEAVAPVLKDLNLSQDQAGKLVGAYAEKVVPLIQQRTLQQIDNQGAELRANLARDLQADPEVGGKMLDESRAFAAKAIAHALPKGEDRAALSQFLNESGLGNHPLLMRVIAAGGRAQSEATTVAGEGGGAPVTDTERFYGKKKG